jgi:Sec-independent protein translocase protein TatA
MPDLLIVLIIALIAVIFWRGPKNLPRLGEALGRGFREARREASDLTGMPGDERTTSPAGSPSSPVGSPSSPAVTPPTDDQAGS